jgi:outer membrane lipoprotein SlyB
MKTPMIYRHLLFTAILALFYGASHGQTPATPAIPDTSKMSYNQISNGLGLFVFPSKGQTNPQQKADEYACYQWAVQQSGIDPMNMPAAAPVQPQSGPTGGAVVGSAKGAAAGAAIGSISGDMGKGAAYGAIIGGVAGRRQGKAAQQQANAQEQSKAKAQDKELHEKFQRAFSVCMEGKGYTLK